MVDIDEGIVAAEVEVVALWGIVVMKGALTVVMGSGTMIEILTMKTGRGPEAEALDAVEGEEAGALVVEGTGAQFGRAVLRGGLKLNSGTGKENRQKQELRVTLLIMMLTATVTHKMVGSTMTTSSSSKEDMVIDLLQCMINPLSYIYA